MQKLKTRIKQLIIFVRYYLTVPISFFIKVDPELWLISERGDEARDNGYFFYRFLKKSKKNVNVKYVISKDSPDIHKIDEKDIVYYQSFKHLLYYIKAKYLISTHIQGYSPEFRSFSKLAKYNIFYKRGKEIMLQHGITQALVSNLVQDKNKKLSLFICGAKPEYDYVTTELGYNDKVAKYTGFARYDTLKKSPKSNMILLMPTWRTYLYGKTDDEFINSDYYQFYNRLINDEKIIKKLEEKKIELIFYPHYDMQKYLHNFKPISKNIVLASKEKYDVQELLIKADYLITDYSSVHFDFAYMKKPMLYTQFDQKEYYANHYSKGYFSHSKNGFGPVATNFNDAVKEVLQCIERNFANTNKYINRTKDFFVYNDNNNCKRIYEEIIKL